MRAHLDFEFSSAGKKTFQLFTVVFTALEHNVIRVTICRQETRGSASSRLFGKLISSGKVAGNPSERCLLHSGRPQSDSLSWVLEGSSRLYLVC